MASMLGGMMGGGAASGAAGASGGGGMMSGIGQMGNLFGGGGGKNIDKYIQQGMASYKDMSTPQNQPIDFNSLMQMLQAGGGGQMSRTRRF